MRFSPFLLVAWSSAALLVPLSPLFAQAATTQTASAVLPSISLDPAKLKFNNTTATPREKGVLRVDFAPSDYPNVLFNAGAAFPSGDWSQAGGLGFTIRNLNTSPLPIVLRIDDSLQADGNRHSRNARYTLKPGEQTSLVFPFDVSAPEMRSAPPLMPGGKPMGDFYGSAIDLKTITAFQLFLAGPKETKALELSDFKLLPKLDFNGMVDRFGQFSRADWPGKVRSENDIKSLWQREQADLQRHPMPADRDQWGAWKGGPQLKATGFFRVALVQNNREIAAIAPNTALPAGARWWIVAPSGRVFWSAGIDVILPSADGPIKGREAMFQELPDDMKQSGNVDFYRLNLQRKYSDNWDKMWVDTAARRLQSWGFNTVGSWSHGAILDARRVPYTFSIGINGLPTIAVGDFSVPDYFDPKFEATAAAAIQDGTKGRSDDAWCLGYFVDNEIPWDGWTNKPLLPLKVLSMPPATPARVRFIEMLKVKYPTPEAWSKAWGIEAKSWDDAVSLTPEALNEAARRDADEFMGIFAERYYSTVARLMRQHAPNQLYLGSRLASRPRPVARAAAKYCDVLSFNTYENRPDGENQQWLHDLGRPILIGEFHFGALDRGMFHGGLQPRDNQAERGRSYDEYLRAALSNPHYVGAHWFQYIDEALTGRFDGENYNIGFVNVADAPYPELRDAARAVNRQIYQIASKAKP